MSLVPYSYHITDDLGCVYSLDNLVIDYFVDSFSSEGVLKSLGKLFSHAIPGWEFGQNHKDDLGFSSKYQFFRSTIWGGGFHLSYGQMKDYDPVDRSFTLLPVLRVKYNPNKWSETPLGHLLRQWIIDHCSDGCLRRFDYAIDVPCKPEDLVVRSSKEAGLFKGTRYFGQRHQHGYVKVYDKLAERRKNSLDPSVDDHPVTRVEITLVAGKPIRWDRFLWLTRGPDPLPDIGVLSPRTLSIVKVLRDLRASGGDVLQALSYFDPRTVEKIEPYTIGTGVQLLSDLERSLSPLLAYYFADLNITAKTGSVNPDPEWLPLDDLEDPDQLPFLTGDGDPAAIEQLGFVL